MYVAADDHKAGGVDDEELKFFKGELARARAAKWAVELAMAAACLFWAFYWLISPDPANSPKYIDNWVGKRTKNRFFNTDGRSGNPHFDRIKSHEAPAQKHSVR